MDGFEIKLESLLGTVFIVPYVQKCSFGIINPIFKNGELRIRDSKFCGQHGLHLFEYRPAKLLWLCSLLIPLSGPGNFERGNDMKDIYLIQLRSV